MVQLTVESMYIESAETAEGCLCVLSEAFGINITTRVNGPLLICNKPLIALSETCELLLHPPKSWLPNGRCQCGIPSNGAQHGYCCS
jgi:hypothetical protein